MKLRRRVVMKNESGSRAVAAHCSRGVLRIARTTTARGNVLHPGGSSEASL